MPPVGDPYRQLTPQVRRRLISQWLASHDRNVSRNDRFTSGVPTRPIPTSRGPVKPKRPVVKMGLGRYITGHYAPIEGGSRSFGRRKYS